MNKDELNAINARAETEVFAELEKLCSSPGYIHAIAHFCLRDNISFIPIGGKLDRGNGIFNFNNGLIRNEIATLIGLTLKNDINIEIPKPEVLSEYIIRTEFLLHEIHMAMQKPWVKALESIIKGNDSKNLKDPFDNAMSLREPIFYGPEAAFDFQYENFSIKKYSSDREWRNSKYGFSIDDAVLIANKIRELTLEKISDLVSNTKQQNEEEFSWISPYSFNLEELADQFKLDIIKIKNFISTFSARSDDKNSSFLNITDFNEITARPIIRLSGNTYILFQPYNLFVSIYESPFYWMNKDKEYIATASKNRGAFAEGFIEERLKKVFKKEYVYKNVHIYRGKNRVSEIDILVLFGDRAIVIQTKAKRLTIEARKGNDWQLKSDFKKAIQDAYDQALLCANCLQDETVSFQFDSGETLEIKKKIKIVHLICAVSDNFPALSTQTRQFIKIKNSHSIKKPIVTDIFFLDVLTELLDSPFHFFNYLTLRDKFDDKFLVNQELALLGFHLSQNLWLKDDIDIAHLADDCATPVDIAMTARRLNIPGDKVPKGILTRFDGTPIGSLLKKFESDPKPEFVGLGMMFLQLSGKTAKHINDGISGIINLSHINKRNYDVSIPSPEDLSGFTIHINTNADDEAFRYLENHANTKKYQTKSKTWYGLLLSSKTGEIRAAFYLESEWTQNTEIDELLKSFPEKPMSPISDFSKSYHRRKIRVNERCPCGSGKKYKKCCLRNIL